MIHPIKKGLELPISGKPVQSIEPGPEISHVALLGEDYNGMKPTMLVAEGDSVKLGQPIFTDKKTEGVTYVAPAAGKIKGVNRGAKRKFLSMEIEIDGDAEITFDVPGSPSSVDRSTAEKFLVQSGLWQSFRTRPYS